MNGCADPGCWCRWLTSISDELGKVESDWLARIADRVVDNARIVSGDRVADLGCGTGLLTCRVAKLVGPGGRVTAIDSSLECLESLERECAGRGLENVSPVPGSLESLPLGSGSVDVAISRSALAYSEDLDRSASEVARVIAYGGRFSVFEPLMGELEWQGGMGTHEEEFLRVEKAIREAGGARSLDRGRLRDVFSSAGLDGESLVVSYGLDMRGREAGEIKREYLFDLPGELSAYKLLERSGFDEDSIDVVVEAFADSAARGEVQGRLPCIFVWGRKA